MAVVRVAWWPAGRLRAKAGPSSSTASATASAQARVPSNTASQLPGAQYVSVSKPPPVWDMAWTSRRCSTSCTNFSASTASKTVHVVEFTALRQSLTFTSDARRAAFALSNLSGTSAWLADGGRWSLCRDCSMMVKACSVASRGRRRRSGCILLCSAGSINARLAMLAAASQKSDAESSRRAALLHCGHA